MMYSLMIGKQFKINQMKHCLDRISFFVTALILAICFFCVMNAKPDELQPEDFKPVLIGRKDLIRNNLILSNNELCKHVIDSMSWQTTSLNKQLFILLDENKELGRQLKECKKK